MRSLIVGVLILVLTFVAYAQEQGFSTQSLWQLSLDALPESANRIFYGDTVVYYFEDDQLNVIDLQTGEALWQIDYPLSKTSYALLPVNGDGLIFVPKDKILEALDEGTGDVVWTYQLKESFDEVFTETFNQTGISYSSGYIFVETGTYLTSIEVKTGKMVWQIEKTRVIRDIEVLNDLYVVITSTAILETGIGHKPHEGNEQKDMYNLLTGQFFWTASGGMYLTKWFNVTDDYADTLIIFDYPSMKKITRYNIKTGEIIAECDISTRGSGNNQLEFDKLGPVWSGLPNYPNAYIFYKDWLYVSSDWYSSTRSVFRFPVCDTANLQETELPEAVSETVDRYLLKNIIYDDVTPSWFFTVPYHGFLLVGKDLELYKVPIPEESFTYLYHNKTDDSVCIAPKFAELDPPPYELIPGSEGEKIATQLIDNLVVILFEDGILKVIDFDTSETLLITDTNISRTDNLLATFYKVNDVLVVESYTFQGTNRPYKDYLYQAFPL
jgi:PQQ-like domain